MPQKATAEPRPVIDGNIVCLGNKNFTMTLEGEDVVLTAFRSNEQYVMSPVPGDDTGIYEIVHIDSGLSLRNFYAHQVRVLLLGGLFLEVTEDFAEAA